LKQEYQREVTADTTWQRPLDVALREIRTLRLLPSADPEAKIQCEFARLQLPSDRNLTTYSALSYVWGERREPCTIWLNGAMVSVTPNLFAALKTFRQPTQMVELWVDALCINQDDIQERNSQVGFMDEIYKNAHEVLMWLGDEAEDSSLGLETVKRANDLFLKGTKEDILSGAMNFFGDKALDPHWIALGRLLKRPYWTRVWILQEVLLSVNNIVCCGPYRLPWAYFVGLFKMLGLIDLFSSEAVKLFTEGAALAMSLAAAYTERIIGEKVLSLSDGLILYRNRAATDPRDYVYGLFGLVSHDGLPVDYGKPLFSVYRDVVRYIINQSQSLDILAACKASIFAEYKQELKRSNAIYQATAQVRHKIREMLKSVLELLPFKNVEAGQDADGTELSSTGTTSIARDNKELESTQAVDDHSQSQPHSAGSDNASIRHQNVSDADQTVAPWSPSTASAEGENEREIVGVSGVSEDHEDQGKESTPSRDIPVEPDVKDTNPKPAKEDASKAPATPKLGLRDTHLPLPKKLHDTANMLAGTLHRIESNFALMPSWIPDWRVPIQESAYLLRNIHNCHYKAAGYTVPQIRHLDESATIMISGVRLDTVGVLAPSVKDTGRGAMDHTIRSDLATWRDGTHPKHIYGDRKGQEAAFLETVVAARNPDGTKGTCPLSVSILNTVYQLELLNESRLDEVETECSNSEISSEEVATVKSKYIWIYNISKHFRFGITKNGHMGRLPVETEVGDIVVVFFGAKVPFVLRKYEEMDMYYLIGECCSTHPKSTFGDRHGPGFVLAKGPAPANRYQEQ
ncbi:hypothetical protein S40288_10283, partial [Stachybotrys chartarum IBT 40288]